MKRKQGIEGILYTRARAHARTRAHTMDLASVGKLMILIKIKYFKDKIKTIN
jgi:hypothetical protein